MSITTFINWLFSQISKVLAWFGDRFNIYLEILNNIGSIINGYIEPVKNSILSTLNSVKQSLEDWFIDTVYKLVDWVNAKVSELSSLVNQLRNELNAYIAGEISGILDVLNQIVQYVNVLINNLRNELIQWSLDTIYMIVENTLERFQPLLQLLEIIDRIIYFFTDNIQDKINYLINTVIPFIVVFIRDPIGFILDLLFPKMLSIACYILALAIGTTSSDIDLKPPWKK